MSDDSDWPSDSDDEERLKNSNNDNNNNDNNNDNNINNERNENTRHNNNNDKQEEEKAEPVILVYLPVGLYLQDNPTSGAIAMQTLVYNATQNNFLFYFYDQAKRPLIAEPVTIGLIGNDSINNCTHLELPFSIEYFDNIICLLKTRGRIWKVQFQDSESMYRFYSFVVLCSAAMYQHEHKIIKCFDLIHGDGKRWKSEKTGVKLKIYKWVLDRDPSKWKDWNVNEVEQADDFIDNHLIDWDNDLRVYLEKLKVGTKRLLISSFHSNIDIIQKSNNKLSKYGWCALLIEIVGVDKKYAKKAKKLRKKQVIQTTTSLSSNKNETVAHVKENKNNDNHDVNENNNGNDSNNEVDNMQISVVKDSINNDTVLEHLKELNFSVENLGNTQNRIFKHVLKEMFENVSDTIYNVEENNIDQLKTVILQTIGEEIRKSLNQFNKTNEKLISGTTNATENSFNILKEDVIHLLNDSENSNDMFNNEKESELRRELIESQNELKIVGEKQIELATQVFELEAKLEKIKNENHELKSKVAESSIFEHTIIDMRKLLEQEIESRNTAEQALRDVLILQKKTKLTWIPKDAVDFCLQCGSRFRMFGKKSSQYCRFCGRMYCCECSSNTIPLPELGYKDAVVVCDVCYKIKNPEE